MKLAKTCLFPRIKSKNVCKVTSTLKRNRTTVMGNWLLKDLFSVMILFHTVLHENHPRNFFLFRSLSLHHYTPQHTVPPTQCTRVTTNRAFISTTLQNCSTIWNQLTYAEEKIDGIGDFKPIQNKKKIHNTSLVSCWWCTYYGNDNPRFSIDWINKETDISNTIYILTVSSF
jgi:hypothetical protein